MVLDILCQGHSGKQRIECMILLGVRDRGFRARKTITSHFRIPSSGQLGPIFTRTILNVNHATSPVVLPQIDPI